MSETRWFGRYELIEKIAQGGMAELWLARQHALPDFERIVVVKKILPELSSEEAFVRMFLDEARTSAQLNHPNIVQVYDFGVKEGSYFLAMEYIDGEDLVEITHRAKELEHPLPVAFSARIAVEVLKALEHSHQSAASVVHRDVSPPNIIVSYDGMVKVVDFGIARAKTQSERTKGGMLKGKYGYLSPEQCRGEVVDHRADLFSLGIVLFELTTGRRLFHDEDRLQILKMVTERPIPKPSEVVPGFPPALEAIILRALERERDQRYPSALAMQVELESFLRSQATPTSNFALAGLMHELFAGIIEEKHRVVASLIQTKVKPTFSEIDQQDAGPPSMLQALPPIDAQVFVRNRHEGLAEGPTNVGAAPLVYVPRRAGPVARPPAPVAKKRRSHALDTLYKVRVATFITVFASGTVFGASLVMMLPSRAPAPIPPIASRLPARIDPPVRPSPPIHLPPRLPEPSLRVDTEPAGATVRIDGELLRHSSGAIAKTPATIDQLEPGRVYDLWIEAPTRQPQRMRVLVDPEVPTKSLYVMLPPANRM